MNDTEALQLHRRLRGKLRVEPKHPLNSREDLALLYTPGVADACQAIATQREEVWELTGRGNSVAVVSDGSAVLGLGDLGPEAALPVMEGKALLFRQFADIDAVPIVLQAREVDVIVEVVRALAPSFGGINLEDIAAPRCFTIEARLRQVLDIPVLHDDQHGTAVVVLAAAWNVLKIWNLDPGEVRVVVNGAGAAGSAIVNILLETGFDQVAVCDREGLLGVDHRTRADHFGDLARRTRPWLERGSLEEVLEQAHLFIGVSAAGVLKPAMVQRMARPAAVFALANPTPEIEPEELAGTHVAITAFGRSGAYNQINNALAFPGLFRGCLDVRSSALSRGMLHAAAKALAGLVSADELKRSKVVPDPFDARVVPAVAWAVAMQAMREGLARQPQTAEVLWDSLLRRFPQARDCGVSLQELRRSLGF